MAAEKEIGQATSTVGYGDGKGELEATSYEGSPFFVGTPHNLGLWKAP